MSLPPIDINLAREALELSICIRCRALVLREDLVEHLQWHLGGGGE